MAVCGRVAPLLALAALLVVTQSASATQAQVPACFGVAPTIAGTEGADSLVGTPGDDVIVALGGDDLVAGLGGNDRICGGSGVDRLYGASTDPGFDDPGNDQLDGGPDMDAVLGGLGDDRLVGGDGIDVVAFVDSRVGVQVSLASGAATGQGTDSITGLEVILGSNLNDVLTGSALADFFVPVRGDDVIRGGAGFDIVIFQFPVQASLATGRATGEGNDALSGLEGMAAQLNAQSVLIGNGAGNFLQGSEKADTIRGSGGDDGLIGLGGDDLLVGGPGFDLVNGGLGSDTLDGGAGVGDTVSYGDALTQVSVNVANRTATAGADRDRLSGFEIVAGSQFDDVLVGDTAANTLQGKGGNDRLVGARGNDFLDGGGNMDRLTGGPGDDYCVDGERSTGCETQEKTPASVASTRRASAISTLRRMFGSLGLGGPRTAAFETQAAAGLTDLTDYSPRIPQCERAKRGKSFVTGIEPPRTFGPVAGISGEQTAHWQGMLMLENRVVFRTPEVTAPIQGPNLIAQGSPHEWQDSRKRVYKGSRVSLKEPGPYRWSAELDVEQDEDLPVVQIVRRILPPRTCPPG